MTTKQEAPEIQQDPNQKELILDQSPETEKMAAGMIEQAKEMKAGCRCEKKSSLKIESGNFDPHEIYAKLSKPLPEKAIERTKKELTRKGYDTTGYKYQFIVNRFNEVLGVGGFRTDVDFIIDEKQTGGRKYEVTCDVRMSLGRWIDGKFEIFAESFATGGHLSNNLGDAKKGAYTNGFKKAAAFFGVGRQAWENSIDDDAVPYPVDEPRVDAKKMTKNQKDTIENLIKIGSIKKEDLDRRLKEKLNKTAEQLTEKEAAAVIKKIIAEGAKNEL